MNSQGSELVNHEDKLTLSFYSPNMPAHFIIVEKSTQLLMVFEQQQSLKLLKTFVCATGENPGQKSVSGDAKTPVGLYFITEIYEDKKVTVFGSRAYHLDYPNVFDKYAGHLGDGIFIHGTNKTLIPYSSNGCITLANEDLDELAVYLKVDAVPIIVLEKLFAPLVESDVKMDINENRFNEVLHELSFTPQHFSPDNIETLFFLTLGNQAIASINYKVYDGNSLEYRYHKRAYLTAAVTENWRTLYSVESQDNVPTLLALQPVKNDLVEQTTATEIVSVPMDMDEELLAFIDKWKIAWANKNIDTYIECYSPTFKNGRLDRNGWKKKKNHLNKKYDFIKVAIRNIAIEWTDAGANVSFLQEYQSDQYHSSGTKLLQLVNRDDRWMIQKEIM